MPTSQLAPAPVSRQQRRLQERKGLRTIMSGWQPFREIPPSERIPVIPAGDQARRDLATRLGVLPDELDQLAEQAFTGTRFFVNGTYEVTLDPPDGDWVHMTIRRTDGTVAVSWADKQRIKSEIVGEECEAVELFPAESEKVDLANTYHLWVNVDPEFRFPWRLASPDVG